MEIYEKSDLRRKSLFLFIDLRIKMGIDLTKVFSKQIKFICIGKKDNNKSFGKVEHRVGNKYIEKQNKKIDDERRGLKEIWLAGGCFWGVEAYLSNMKKGSGLDKLKNSL